MSDRVFTCRPYQSTAGRVHRAQKPEKPGTLTVDIHCHIHTAAADKLGRQQFPVQNEPFFKWGSEQTRKISAQQNVDRWEELTGVDKRIRDMDEMQVDIQAISTDPALYFYDVDPDLGRQTSRMINDNIADAISKYPDRLVGMGTVPLQNTEMAIAELEYCVKELGFRAIEIGPNVRTDELSAERLEKFWSACEERDVLIFIHPMSFTHGERLKGAYFSNIIANPLSTTVAVHYLIFDGVMERHPGLKFVLAHGGGYVAHYPARLDHAWGAREDCRCHIKQPPTEYLKKFYMDTVVFNPKQLQHLANEWGVDKLMLGTDYPYDMAEYDPVELVDQMEGWTPEEKAKVWGLTAAKLLGIKT